MNVIIANERNQELSSLTIDVIKKVEGVYPVNELVAMFTNFFFNKMILDITSIKDYNDYRNLKQFFQTIDVSKVILYLADNSACNSKEFISNLITLGVYNFTNNFSEIMTLYEHPRTYSEVSHLQITKSSYEINAQIDASEQKEEKEFVFAEAEAPANYAGDKRVIGVINLTEHAGATTLVVQMVKQLNLYYNAIGIEMNKQDFVFFDTENIYSCTSKDDAIKKINSSGDIDAVIIDLNNMDPEGFCSDVIYLMEPGTIKMTKLIKKNGKIFEELSGQKLILNRANLDDNEVSEFEVESHTKIFCVVSNFRDNLERVISVDKLLSKLGYRKCGRSGADVSIKKHGFFKK